MYPKIAINRNDNRQQVVVANAEQEAQLPDEFRPLHDAPGASGIEYAELKAARAQLEADRLALEEDRAALTAGYQESMAELDADRAALKAEREAFEAAKAAAPTKRTTTKAE